MKIMKLKSEKPTIVFQKEFWTVASVTADPSRYYIFGDNEAGWGKGGQACIRGLANAYGIPTLHSPGVYWSDAGYDANVKSIESAISKIPTDKPWVISADGLGTGLADLPNQSPKTFAYLQSRIQELAN